MNVDLFGKFFSGYTPVDVREGCLACIVDVDLLIECHYSFKYCKFILSSIIMQVLFQQIRFWKTNSNYTSACSYAFERVN